MKIIIILGSIDCEHYMQTEQSNHVSTTKSQFSQYVTRDS